MAPKGISLHIGLNRVDPGAYNGWDGALSGCENDARAMKAIADACGYGSSMMLNDAATSAAVIQAIGQTAQQLSAGDYFLLTYSGHGGQVQDVNGDEDDGLDETWVLFDRMLVDDELYSLWSQFTAGVRIFMLSDSCHSGTVARDAYVALHAQLRGQFRGLPEQPRFKAIPKEISRAVEAKNRDLYHSVQWISGNSRDLPVQASLILISGCQDNQLSQDGDENGLFTQNLLQVWNGGQFQGDYRSFHSAILQKMPPTQTPNYFKVGAQDDEFETHEPFDILGGMSVEPEKGASTSTTTSTSTSPAPRPSAPPAAPRRPSVTGPDRATDAPRFTVDLAGAPYYVLEIARDEATLDAPPDPNGPTYYGSWNDPAQPARLTSPTFQLPDAAWKALSVNGTLCYRVTTTTSASAWDGAQTSEVRTLTVAAERARELPQAPAPVIARRSPRAANVHDLP